jgi:hypothetical protein
MKLGRKQRVRGSPCPHCNKPLDAGSGAGHNGRPRPGDLTVCAYCAEPSRFGPDLALVKLDTLELQRMAREDPAAHQELQFARAVIRTMDK